MASPSTIITLGYGSFGTAGSVLTLGFGIGSGATLVYGPVTVSAALASPAIAVGQAAAFGSETVAAVPIGSLAAEARV